MILSTTGSPECTLSPARRKRRTLLAALLVSAVALLSLLPPDELPLPSCMFRELTGHSCFTCGLTRSLMAAARGNLSASLEYHLMGPVLLLGLLAAVACLTAEALTGKQWLVASGGKFLRVSLLLLAIVWITYGGVRLVLEIA